MQTTGLLRQQITESLQAPQTEKVVENALGLWERLAAQIISIVGEDGFNSLYARSVFISQATFPWLAAGSVTAHNGQRFDELKMSFKGRAPAQASAASSLLLITFTDILSSLIGEQLAARILHSAWSDAASDRIGKELKNG